MDPDHAANDCLVEQPMPTTDEQQQEGYNMDAFTETTRIGALTMRARRADIDSKIDVMIAAGVEFLDQMKAQYVARLERIKDELDAYCNGAVDNWGKVSEETQQTYHRLQAAQQLVQSLGLEAIK